MNMCKIICGGFAVFALITSCSGKLNSVASRRNSPPLVTPTPTPTSAPEEFSLEVESTWQPFDRTILVELTIKGGALAEDIQLSDLKISGGTAASSSFRRISDRVINFTMTSASESDSAQISVSISKEKINSTTKALTADPSESKTTSLVAQFSRVLGAYSLDEIDFISMGITYGGGCMSTDGTRLFMSDARGRLRVFNTPPKKNGAKADFVLGRPSKIKQTTLASVATASTLGDWPSNAYAAAGANGRFYVSDGSNNRVLIFNSLTGVDGQEADMVLGQPNLESNASNNGGISASTFAGPGPVLVVGGKLYVLDVGNHRLLVWNSEPTSNQQAADFVIGQANFTTGSTGTFSSPAGMVIAGGHLYVVSTYGDVSYWATVPTSTSATPTSSWAFSYGTGIASNGAMLAISQHRDAGNRVLIFDTLPTAGLGSPSRVLGQSSTSATGAGRPQGSMRDFGGGPGAIAIVGNWIYVADGGISRGLAWDTLTPTDYQTATIMLGSDPDGENVNRSAKGFGYPYHVASDGSRIIVTDYYSDAGKIFPVSPATRTEPETYLGSPSDLRLSEPTGIPSVSASSLHRPLGMGIGHGVAYAADPERRRILIWNSIPSASNENSSVALGQSSTSAQAAAAGASQSNLQTPHAVHYDGTWFYTTDTGDHRLLGWSSLPTSSGASPQIVLGQADFTGESANRGGSVASNTLSSPRGVFSTGKKLIVSDSGNNRVLIWNERPTASNTAPSIVIGQANFTTSSANQGLSVLSATTLSNPTGLFVDENGALFVVDTGNNRILVWSSIPTTNNQPATGVIGQIDFKKGGCNESNVALSASLCYPTAITKTLGDSTYWISDTENFRVVGLRQP